MTIISFLKLVEIQTKVASMIPLLIGTTYTLYRFQSFSIINFFLMLISLLTFDMTTTALNNYMDYKRAIKKYGYGYESHNAIVSHNLKESTVVTAIIVMLVTAAFAGVLLYLNTGFIVLLLGAISFAIGILYSYGPIPISRTPFGEIFSGFTMGFIITFLSVYIHTMDLDIVYFAYQSGSIGISVNLTESFYILLISILPVCGISNIMLANNICDIEDDIENKRYTLPIYIGREAALKVFQAVYYAGYAAVILALLLGVLPVTSIALLATWVIVHKNIKIFFDHQSKKDTFVLSVKNFILSNTVHIAALILGVLLKKVL